MAAAVAAPSAGAALPREVASASADASFDLFTGVWVDTRSVPEQRLVLRQLPGGELHGIFWTTSGRPPDPETLDPEFLDLVGVADPEGSTVAQVGVSIPGGLDLYELELDPWSFPWQLTLTKPGLTPWFYRYESGGDNRAVVELGRSWAPNPARRGKRVRIAFELRGLGPRAVASGAVLLTVIVPRSVGGVAIEQVSTPQKTSACTHRGPVKKTRSSWVLRCYFLPVTGTKRVFHVDVNVPKSFRAKYLNVFYELGLAKGWRETSGLEEILARGADPEATLKIRVLPAQSGGGGGGGQTATRTFTNPTGTVTVPGSGATATGRILFPQAIITPQAAANEYCQRVDADGRYTMTGTSKYKKAIAFEAEAGGSQQAVGLLLWEIVPYPLGVLESITCST